MSKKMAAPAALTRALALRGFALNTTDCGEWFRYCGALIVDGESYPVELEVDPVGKDLPQIRLTPIPDELQPVAAHVFPTGHLCYAAAGTIVLDVFDLVGQVMACIDRGTEVLGKILRGEMVKDMEDEFFACWPSGAFCFLDLEGRQHVPARAIVLQSALEGGHSPIAVTEDIERTTRKLVSCGFSVDMQRGVRVRCFRTEIAPRPLQSNWPPKTVANILHWQAIIDHRTRKKLEDAIIAEAKTDTNGLVCVVQSPRFTYAFAVVFKRSSQRSTNRATRELAYSSAVIPMYCLRIDDTHIAQRNTPGRATLAGKKLALVGCGTIGGFLAEYLVKAGAGTNGGELNLYDTDILFPHNVGRHRLGFNSIRQNKAVALGEELSRTAPSATIRPFPVDALDADLSGVDLVIDATGEEALGHLFAKKFSGEAFRPFLSVWVAGPGTAVRALLRDSSEAACVRCLKTVDRRQVYPVGGASDEVVFAGHGCESLYVPFPVTASIQAACLAVGMALDWAAGTTHARLRTCILDGAVRGSIEQVDPRRQAECPACSA
ncbi:ThiF family adenylyltransferase [Pandoraea commovens]|uniref:Thiamine biosynthesis protein ThiF n=1 Tax=Pandoraea commovens TaxID=2508289 RepID=A0A5E4RGY4_9BURK|nr:ThiF family adenylyltransferase [Pandoraea commovens]VVD62606.1 thiamine biosynthesis protein ThiF [Pandoraea commovens]